MFNKEIAFGILAVNGIFWHYDPQWHFYLMRWASVQFKAQSA